MDRGLPGLYTSVATHEYTFPSANVLKMEVIERLIRFKSVAKNYPELLK
jgi:hypothetical protein